LKVIARDHLRHGVSRGGLGGIPSPLRESRALVARSARASALLVTLRKLRPTKIRNAVSRRWFEWSMSRHGLRDAPGLVDLGSKPGGWTIPTGLVESDWLCYCVGAGGDVSFDRALMRDFGVTVRSFDPATRYAEAALIEVGAGRPFTAYRVALATDDGPISMQLSHEPGSESMSANALYETHRYVQRPGRRLATLMEELGDDRVDLLKVDIEGAEYQVIPELDLHAAGVSVFSVQLHHNGGVRAARRMIDCLRAKGFDPVACRPAVKVTFVRRDLLSSPSAGSRSRRVQLAAGRATGM